MSRYLKDKNQNDMLISSKGQQVMMEWEKSYMEKCVDILNITENSNVLEIGFGCGYSATKISFYTPKKHTIIECDLNVYKKLMKWSKEKNNVHIIYGTWQNEISKLGEFDCVFFDDYPLPENENKTKLGKNEISVSRWHDFLDNIINWHLKVNGRVTGYLARKIFTTRKNCEIKQIPLKIEVPSNCKYYDSNEIFIPLITLVKKPIMFETYQPSKEERMNYLNDKKKETFYSVLLKQNKYNAMKNKNNSVRQKINDLKRKLIETKDILYDNGKKEVDKKS